MLHTARACLIRCLHIYLNLFTISEHQVLTLPPQKNHFFPIFSHPSPLLLFPSLLTMSQRLNPSHILSLQKHHYTSQRHRERGERRGKRLWGGCRRSKSGGLLHMTAHYHWDKISENRQIINTAANAQRVSQPGDT